MNVVTKTMKIYRELTLFNPWDFHYHSNSIKNQLQCTLLFNVFSWKFYTVHKKIRVFMDPESFHFHGIFNVFFHGSFMVSNP